MCALARALDVVGERWSLLVIRDLIGGPRRFTDLLERLGGVTPKLLTTRLRQLESAGLIEVDRKEGRREVWYRLTRTGRDLEPALEALTSWGIRHARRAPLPGEVSHPDHLLKGLTIALNDSGVAPPSPVTWQFRFPGGDHAIAFDGANWVLGSGTSAPAVVVTTTPGALGEVLMSASPSESVPAALQVDGEPEKVQQFLSVFGGKTAARSGAAVIKP